MRGNISKQLTSYVRLISTQKVGELTELEMLLRASHELSNPSCEALREHVRFALPCVCFDKKAKNFHKVSE